MGLSISKSQPVYPLPNPAFAQGSNVYGYPPFGYANPGQGGRKKDRVNSYGMYPPFGYGYSGPVYPPTHPSSYHGYGYPAFPPTQAPFVPPPPVVRPPTDPGPPLFVPSATQHANHASVQSPPVIPSSTLRRAGTPHPSAFPESQLQPPQPQPQPRTSPPRLADPPSRDTAPVVPITTLATGTTVVRSGTLKNPLPPPPRDVYDTTPYRELLTLPRSTALLTTTYGTSNPTGLKGDASVGRKKSLKGLFRTLSGSKKKRDENFVPMFPVVMSQPQTSTSTAPPATSAPAPVPGPAPDPTHSRLRFDHHTYPGFMNHSAHRILYHNKTYPTALHLHEALKFIDHRPDLSEKIRHVSGVQDVYPLSATLQEFVRPDWGQIFLKMMEEVLYLKFKQHPDLRSLLHDTGSAQLIYAESNDTFWGDGPSGQGSNELGKTLVRVRDRLREESRGV